MRPFSPHAGSLTESETLAIAAAAKRLRAQGVDIAPFAAGEPDFATPAAACEAGIRAIREGKTKYGPSAGSTALREAVARSLARGGHPGIVAEDTIVTAGAKSALQLALWVLLSEGDEVVVPAPAWLSYKQMVQAVGGRTKFVPTSAADGHAIDPDRVRKAIGPRTRAIVVNSPNNPTGAVATKEVLAALAQLAIEHDLAVISDEIYELLVYAPAQFVSFLSAAPEAADRTLVVNGVSKSHAMTGWRVGWAGGPRPWVSRMIRLQSHATSGPPEIGQAAALAALEGPTEALTEMRNAFHRRRDVMVDALGKVPGWTVPHPDGAFYVLPDVSAWFGRSWRGHAIPDAPTLARLLLEHAHAAVVPGDAFEAPQAIRLSYACDEALIRSGMARIADFAREVK